MIIYPSRVIVITGYACLWNAIMDKIYSFSWSWLFLFWNNFFQFNVSIALLIDCGSVFL